MLWYIFFQARGHQSEECLYLQKIVSNPQIVYCKLFLFVGHNDKDCQAYKLLEERTIETYFMKGDEKAQVERGNAQFNQSRDGLCGHGRGVFC